MKRVCRKIRSTLAGGGPAALRNNDQAQEHLSECDGCFDFLEALVELENAFSEMPSLDAEDELVERLLAQPELKQPVSAPATQDTRGLRWFIEASATRLAIIRSARIRWGIVAIPAVVLVGLLSIFTIKTAVKDMPLGADLSSSVPADPQYSEKVNVVAEVDFISEDGEYRQGAESQFELEESDIDDGSSNAPMKIAQAEPMRREVKKESRKQLDDSIIVGNIRGDKPASIAAPARPARPVVKALDPIVMPEPTIEDLAFSGVTFPQSRDRFQAASPSDKNLLPEYKRKKQDEAIAGGEQESGRREYALAKLNALVSKDIRIEEEVMFDRIVTGDNTAGGFANEIVIDRNIAEEFLKKRKNLNDLVFKDNHGYWANTYVPGDRFLRSLKARIESQERTLEEGATLRGLHQASHQTSQPFDSPDASALALFLHADSTGVDARERLRVQIGIKGTNRRAGLRPPMNVGLVLDLRGNVSDETTATMRALVAAFAAASDLSDRFSLTIAGRSGGCLVQPGNFRHGPLSIALGEVFTEQSKQSHGLSLLEAINTATETVRNEDDPTAPLGSSVVILITGQALDMQSALINAAHESSIEGVPVSAIGIGSSVHLDELDQLVLAGQGNRRLLDSGLEAEALVARELRAVSRVVARAVRLRIELAPGVQLIDVLGSHSLDEARAQQVRDRENAIDQRLSRNLGIVADRGLDESGIQIVIPSFYAADSHVIVLDVVVPGPGPVADVSVRYKDLVHMKNGVAQAHLTIGRDRRNPGPLELNVLKNQLAHEFGLTLATAAGLVAAGQTSEATTVLEEFHTLLVQLPGLIDGLANDRDLEGDRLMLKNYIAELDSLQSNGTGQLLIDSMRYAGRLKVLSIPLGEDN